MLKRVPFNQYLPQVMELLPRGAFLTVAAGNQVNTMTIGWANFGILWSMPILTVAVRYTRHTYSLMEQSNNFTVSIPLEADLKQALAFCGTKSGRDWDKFKECGLTARPGQAVASPVVGECDLHYECQLVYKQAMEPGLLHPEVRNRTYPKHDYHVLYYGKIVCTWTDTP